MTLPVKLRTFLILAILTVGFSGCDSSSPDTDDTQGVSQLVGNYELVSITDRTGDITTQPGRTLLAGVPNPVTVNVGGGQTTEITFVVTGSLSLSSTSYSFDMSISSQADGQTQTQTESSAGTWTTEGATMTLIDAAETQNVTWSLVQGRLTLTSTETELVFQRQ